MFVIKYKKIFFSITILLTILSVLSFFVFGLNFGIDFAGGSVLEVSYKNIGEVDNVRPAQESVKASLDELGLGEYSVRPSGDEKFIIQTKSIGPEEKNKIIKALSINSSVPQEERFNSIGPVVGQELRNKSYVAISVAILAIVLFVTFAFRKVSKPVASWKYGLATIIALVHDVLIPAGVFVVFSHWYGGDIDLLFVTALLAILGYSVHDTIVVFDRVRENLREAHENRSKEDFETTVGQSITQTMGRSINTSLTIFLVLVALYYLGGEATRNFTFVLMVGIIAGTYSSIFLASPLLVLFEKIQKK